MKSKPDKGSRQTHIFNQTNNIKIQIKISQKRNFELTGGFGGNMGKENCNFFGSRELPIDIGSTKAIGLEVSRGSDKRLEVSNALFALLSTSREPRFENIFSNWLIWK